MSFHRWCLLVQIFIAICGRVTNTTTELSSNSTANFSSTNDEPFNIATTPPDNTDTMNFTSVNNDTLEEDLVGFTAATIPNGSTAPAVVTEGPPATTVQPVQISKDCLCDLTPGFCDIDCCCDTADCNTANLNTLFTGCPQKSISGVCVEKWLMFWANVDPALVTVTDSLFCIQSADKAPHPLPAQIQYPALEDSYHFSPPAPTNRSYSRDFYRVDDVIQTYFSDSSVRGLLRQPSPGTVGSFCVNYNPAKFLRSVSLSCTRMLSPQSCTTDPNLSARSYFSSMSLIKIPIVEMARVSEFLIPVTPLSNWSVPKEHNNTCLNVVKEVEFIIGYTARGELTYANVNVVLTNAASKEFLMQTHSVRFQLEAEGPPSGGLIPTVGLRIGSPVLGQFDGKTQPLTTLGVSPSGECSSDPSGRSSIRFTYNVFTGCTLSLSAGGCSELRSQIYTILEGLATPDAMAMNSGSKPEWTRVITERCPAMLEETCETGCVLPKSLSIQVLWARQGLLDLPQNYILGAKYLFQCQKFKCPTSSPIALTTEVTFVDTTVYPEPPRGTPQAEWKFPFGFFSRGITELDGHVIITNGTEKVTWSLILFTVMLLTGLEFFIR